MDRLYEPVTRRDFIREKHKAILQQYLDLLKREREENPQRAEHIGKFYYAQSIAQSMTPPMDPRYVLRVINNQLCGGDKRN